jgi:hypothetical protein
MTDLRPGEESEIPEVDWHGVPLDCARCAARDASLDPPVRCQLGHACVQDRYARRIDRFFRWNPAQANAYLSHAYFEVRAIACRYADVFHLRPLIDDEDETVRLSVAARLPLSHALPLRADPHREVRIRMAMRLEGRALMEMKDDPDYGVRLLVARRAPAALLTGLVRDAESEVRLEIARRLPMPQLLVLCDDKELAVRRQVTRRLPRHLLSKMATDPAWEVRYEVAERAEAALAARLADEDDEPEVRAMAAQRLASLIEKAWREGVSHG